jgi:hypothetical protein
MFGQLLRVAEGHLRRFLTGYARRARTFRDWFWSEGDRETLGLKLLREWLSPDQLAQYDAKRYFDVTGCDTRKRYRIHHGVSMNIHEIDGVDQPRVGWCFVPNTCLPAGDVMLAQKIALETDESGALAVAKKFAPKETQLNMLGHL